MKARPRNLESNLVMLLLDSIGAACQRDASISAILKRFVVVTVGSIFRAPALQTISAAVYSRNRHSHDRGNNNELH